VYLREHPVDKPVLQDLPYHELKDYTKNWFWELHNWVNQSLQRPPFPYDQLTPSYAMIDIRKNMKDLDTPMKRAIRVRSGQLISYNEFVKQVNILLSVY